MIKKIFLILSLLTIQNSFSKKTVRNEISSYILNHDRLMIDRYLRVEDYFSFFSFSSSMSSGTISLFNEIQSKTSSGTPSTKTLSVLEILNQNINSEYLVEINSNFGIPLPIIKFKKISALPSLFFNFNLGIYFSFSNQDDVIDPLGQIYLKKDTKIGLGTKIKVDQNTEIIASIYYGLRSDNYTVHNSSALALQKQIFALGNLDQNQKMINLDLSYAKKFKQYKYLIEINEIQLTTLKGSLPTHYGKRPMAHIQTQYFPDSQDESLSFLLGLHQRKQYSLLEGIYLSFIYNFKTRVPVKLTGKIDPQFLSFTPQIDHKRFKFTYAVKTPFTNPNRGLWGSTIHTINLNFPF